MFKIVKQENMYFMVTKYYLISLLLLLLFYSCNDKDLSKTYHKNGQLKEIGRVVKDQREGFWITFDSKGDTLGKDYFHLGEMLTHSIYINNYMYYIDSIDGTRYRNFSFHNNGILQSKSAYIDNKQEGESNSYYQNGKIKVESNYKNGKLHGEYTQYYPSGKMQYYSKNIGNGIHFVYDSLGKLTYEIIYKNMMISDTIKIY